MIYIQWDNHEHADALIVALGVLFSTLIVTSVITLEVLVLKPIAMVNNVYKVLLVMLSLLLFHL